MRAAQDALSADTPDEPMLSGREFLQASASAVATILLGPLWMMKRGAFGPGVKDGNLIQPRKALFLAGLGLTMLELGLGWAAVDSCISSHRKNEASKIGKGSENNMPVVRPTKMVGIVEDRTYDFV